MDNKRFLNATDVAEYLGVSESKAYKIIQTLNKELKEKGFITIAGKISRVYFLERVYAGEKDK
ncbi:helix-turn-helix domain-containing protein [Aristaeella lactis]|jgi:prophage antirepressor-like protein|uniref:Mga helix-turn-helix domain-containing protein n=1 Tax=Aristaeella lactis TaxID=3046383 RepID=A0AC61PJF4_9FIRM|nr:helix-turn-helix domain-containing protein [Aristaeella lactis]QUA54095.1 helix-turn-helix domain-containing protein [Aristaeella lactis]SMC43324.1 Mga helix-turn-helix domain-containing protein [Aristaeella lactis]